MKDGRRRPFGELCAMPVWLATRKNSASAAGDLAAHRREALRPSWIGRGRLEGEASSQANACFPHAHVPNVAEGTDDERVQEPGEINTHA